MSAALFAAFQKLHAREPIRMLLCSVHRSDGVIDMKASAEFIRETAKKLDRELAYSHVLGWLFQVYYTALELPIPNEWWFSMHKYVEDLLVIGTVLAGDRIRLLCAPPTIESMPMCLLALPSRLKIARAYIQETHRKTMTRADDTYVQLFTQAPASD